MANNILTIDMITREAVELFKNTNAFIKSLRTQYDASFAVTGAKIGDTLRVRLPNDYVVSDGPALSAQDTSEQSINLTVQYQRHVDLSWDSSLATLSIDDYSERFLYPAVNNLAGNVASTIMGGAEGGVCNLVAKTDGGGAITNPTTETVNEARAVLGLNSAPTAMGRKLVLDLKTMSRLTSSASGFFNPATDISKQYREGITYNALGFDWMEDQTAIVHTTGSFTAGTVNGAGQTGTTLVTNAITGTLNQGDIITIDGVNAVNRVTKETTGEARQFVVTADVASGATSIPIYPALIPPAADGSPVQYQTVTASPDNAAAISLATNANEVYRKSIGFAPDAITMATADLVSPPNREVSRRTYDGVRMRILRDYLAGTDQMITRIDVLFGFLFIRPEWCVVLADAI